MVKAQDGNAVALSSPTSLEDTRKIWYFAYGSNMRASVMQNRGIAAIAKEIAVVPSHVLSFDVFGVPYSEPAMGSITRRKDLPLDKANYVPSVHGVACLVSHADYVRLLVSEGAGTAYKEVELDAFIIPVGEKTYGNGVKEEDGKTRPRPITIKVHTLVARYPFRPNAPPRPSRRYLVSRTPLHEHKHPFDIDLHLMMATTGPLNSRRRRARPTCRISGLSRVPTRLHKRHIQTCNHRRLCFPFPLATTNPARHALG